MKSNDQNLWMALHESSGRRCSGVSRRGRDLLRTASAELLGQCDDDAFGAAHVAEPVAVLVLLQLADEFGAVGVQAGEDVLDVLARRT